MIRVALNDLIEFVDRGIGLVLDNEQIAALGEMVGRLRSSAVVGGRGKQCNHADPQPPASARNKGEHDFPLD